MARFQANQHWYGGVLRRIHPDGSCDVDYDDGDKERRVPKVRVRLAKTALETNAELTREAALLRPRVQALKERRGWSNQDLAREAGDNQTAVSNMLNGLATDALLARVMPKMQALLERENADQSDEALTQEEEEEEAESNLQYEAVLLRPLVRALKCF